MSKIYLNKSFSCLYAEDKNQRLKNYWKAFSDYLQTIDKVY